jgi:hypothetical protein
MNKVISTIYTFGEKKYGLLSQKMPLQQKAATSDEAAS